MRMPNWAFNNSFSSFSRAAWSLPRSSVAFIYDSLLSTDLAYDKRRGQWQFGGSQAECFACQFFSDAVHFVQDFARLDLSDVVFRVTFTVTHTNFCRLVRNRLVREDTDPDTTATFDVTGHGTTCRFDLASRDTAAGNGLQAELTERHSGAAGVRNAGVTAFLLFTILSAGWLQHAYSPALSAAAGFAARRPAGAVPGLAPGR